MTFVSPTYLWALLGLLVPLAIHLWSNKTGRTIKVGSVQLFQESDSSKSRSIKLNEYALLLLRSLLICLLVLILAEPQIKSKQQNTKLTYIIEPSLLFDNQIKKMVDTLQSDDAIRSLQIGLPEIEDIELQEEYSNTPNYWQLAQQMQDLDTDSIVVFTSASYSGIKGMRPTLNKNIEWIIVDNGKKETREPIVALNKNKRTEVISAVSDAELLSFKTEVLVQDANNVVYNESRDSISFNGGTTFIALIPESAQTVQIYYDDTYENQLYFLKSSINAIAKYLDNTINIVTTQNIEEEQVNMNSLVIWLSDQQPPTLTTKMLIYKPDDLASSIIENGATINIFYLTKKLSASVIVTDRLAEQLLPLLSTLNISNNQLKQLDKRVMAKAQFVPGLKDGESDVNQKEMKTITKWLWLLFIPILILERFVARQRKQ